MASRGKNTAGTNGEGREGGARRCAGGSRSRSHRGLESLSRGGRGPHALTAQVGSLGKPAGLGQGPQSRTRGPSPSRPAPWGRGQLRVPDCLLEGARGSCVPPARPSCSCGHLSTCPCSGPQARAHRGAGLRWWVQVGGPRGSRETVQGLRPKASHLGHCSEFAPGPPRPDGGTQRPDTRGVLWQRPPPTPGIWGEALLVSGPSSCCPSGIFSCLSPSWAGFLCSCAVSDHARPALWHSRSHSCRCTAPCTLSQSYTFGNGEKLCLNNSATAGSSKE